MQKLLVAILESLAQLNPVLTAIFAVVTFFVGLFNFGNEMWGAMVSRVAQLTLPDAMAVVVLDGFGFVDWCFPLSELFTFITAWAATFVLCVVIRIIKSFIPLIGA